MTTEIITIDVSATFHDATELLGTNHTNFIVINRHNNADELGLVVMSLIARKVLMKNPSPKRDNIYATMSKTMISLAAKMSIVYKIHLLSRFGLSRALAVDHDSDTPGIIIMHNMVLRDVSYSDAEYVSTII